MRMHDSMDGPSIKPPPYIQNITGFFISCWRSVIPDVQVANFVRQ